MINHSAIQLALRVKALTLSVATTGSTALAATTTGYTRAAGSFIADGFRVGMEVAGTGFAIAANNTAKVITAVTATVLSCPGCATEAEGTRTLDVGLPSLRLWENIPLTTVQGRPYVAEQYLPGPMLQATLGTLGELEATPIYVLQFYGVENTGLEGIADYADALLTLFAPGTSLAVNGDTLRVRRIPAPFRGQLLHVEPGWSMLPVNIPCRIRTANTI